MCLSANCLILSPDSRTVAFNENYRFARDKSAPFTRPLSGIPTLLPDFSLPSTGFPLSVRSVITPQTFRCYTSIPSLLLSAAHAVQSIIKLSHHHLSPATLTQSLTPSTTPLRCSYCCKSPLPSSKFGTKDLTKSGAYPPNSVTTKSHFCKATTS